jgi:hypothetical protein
MPGACLNSWRTDGCEWSIGYLWRSSDWFEHLVFFALALMLVYTGFVVSRFYYRHYLDRRSSRSFAPDSARAVQRHQKRLLAELRRGIGTLKSIASTAPFLGLAGTCYGMLDGLRSMTGTWDPFVMAAVPIGASLATAVAGIIVAIPAVLSYNLLLARIESFERDLSNVPLADCTFPISGAVRSFQFAQRLPLQKRFSNLPPFPVLAAPVLASLVATFVSFEPYKVPTGLYVRLLEIGSLDNRHHPVKSVVISVVRGSANGSPVVRVNSKETSLDNLEDAVAPKRTARPQTAYVEAEDTLAWDDVAKVIDAVKGLDANVVLLTNTPNVTVARKPTR